MITSIAIMVKYACAFMCKLFLWADMYKVHIVIIIAITVQLAEQQRRNTSIGLHKTLTAHYHENYAINSGCSEVEINLYWDKVFV